MCLVYIVGFVFEYLSMLEDKLYFFIGCVVFEKILFNVFEESVILDDVVLFVSLVLLCKQYYRNIFIGCDYKYV